MGTMRCMHGVDALAYDDDIAAVAQEWATTGTCDKLEHSGGQYGENIYWASPAPSDDEWVHGVESWYSEIEYTSDGATSDWCDGQCGHYTQVVWASATRMGCGTCEGTMVCNYDAGNMQGEFADNVLATKYTWDECTAMVSAGKKWTVETVYPVNPVKLAVSAAPGMDSVLYYHNTMRCMHGVDALAYDDDIAAVAQEWATTGTCDKLEHSGGQYGENIYWASPAPSDDEWVHGVESWYSEIEYTSDGATSDWCDGQCGHYTQVVWASATRMGCGTCEGTMVCNYDAGNMQGEFADNVFATKYTWEECASMVKAGKSWMTHTMLV